MFILCASCLTNKTATIIENIVLFDVSAYAQAIIRNKRNATVKGKIRMQFRAFVLLLRHIDHYVLKSSRGMDEPPLRSGWCCCIRRDSSR